MLKAIPKDYHDPQKGTLKLLWEDEWRALGITQVRWNSMNSVNSTDMRIELGLGALRGPRAGATHSTVQVSLP